MALSNDESKIDRRERDLYSRNIPQEKDPERGGFSKPVYDVSENWQSGDSFSAALTKEYTVPDQKNGFFKKFFIGSVVFFFVAVLVFLYMSYGGFNTVSSKNVDIFVQGPVAIDGGEVLVLDIAVKNNNNVPLEGAELLVEYPSGTREAGNIAVELTRYKEDVGNIAPGESVTKTVKSVLFGEKDTVKNIKVSVEYKAKGSNATFTKEKNYEINIKSSPVLVTVEYPKEVNSNQKMELVITVISSSNALIENLLVDAEYPFGFAFESATPQPSFGNNVWKIGDLNPKEKRTIKIIGKMEGQNDEEKTFRFNAGTPLDNDEKVIGIDFVTSAETILIRKPFFDVSLALDNDTQKDHVVEIGKQINGRLVWTNNLPVSVNDVVLDVTLGGSALDRNKVGVDQQGFYQSAENKISWDKRNTPVLAEIKPGQNGTFTFNFSTLNPLTQNISALRNPEANIDIKIKGIRFSDTEPPEEISYSFNRKVKVNTQVTFNPRVVYSIGPFENSGALPPKAEKETTYTILWTISNSFNDITNATVSASLPTYVKWVDIKSPASDRLLYNPSTNKVVWEPGDIKAGMGFGSSPREVAFQVSILPSLSQVGIAPTLIEDMTLTAVDKFTGNQVLITSNPVTTRISTDPIFDFQNDIVVK